MKNFSKFTTPILILFILISCINFPVYAAKTSRMSGSRLDIEAESSAVEILGGKNKVSSDGIVNSGGEGITPAAGKKGELYFEFKTPEAGTYEIWALASPLSATKSIYASINGGEYVSAPLCAAKDIFFYAKLAAVTVGGAEKVSVSLTANNGWYTIDKFTVIKSGYALKNPDGTVAGSQEAIDSALEQIEKTKVYPTSIPGFKVTGNGKFLSIADVGLSEWWSKKSADGIDAMYVSEGRSNTPSADARGDIEFDFTADSDGFYYIWAYIYPRSVSKTIWLNNGITGGFNRVSVGTIENAWQWTSLGAYNVRAGKKTSVKMIPALSSYYISNLYIVKGHKMFPVDTSGKLTDEPAFDDRVVYPAPTLTPPKGVHPRVMFTAKDIPQIKENMNYEGNSAALERYKINLASDTDGTLPSSVSSNTNFDCDILNIIQSRAFEYVINGDRSMGEKAVSSLRNFVNTVVFDFSNDQSYNYFGEAEYVIGCVYDWCYDLLDDKDKKLFRNAVIKYASHKIGYPPTKMGAVTGHGTEGPLMRDLLAPAIAMYDEYPSIYENAAGRLYSEYVPAKKFLYRAHMSEMQGQGYTNYREKWAAYTLYLMDAIGEKNIFGEDMEYAYHWLLYARRPDGALLYDGDSNGESESYHLYATYPDLPMLLANYYGNPYIKWEYLRQQYDSISKMVSNQSVNCTTMFICNKRMEAKSPEELPLSHYFAEPKGGYIARTSWDEGYNANTVLCEFKINEYWTSNHQHLDAGAFQLYYKGYLAADSGYYKTVNSSGAIGYGSEHWKNFYTKTIAHNCMLVYDPDEPMVQGYTANDGGQELKNSRKEVGALEQLLSKEADMKVGEILGHEAGLDTYAPNYTYLKGDLTNAYSDKVEEYQRSFMFLNLKNDQHPAALVVFDHVVSSNPSFKKSFALNTVAEPEISGSRLTATDTRVFDAANKYNGKMTVDTLMPTQDNLAYAKYVDDDKYSYSGSIDTHAEADDNSDGNGTRTEISPKKASAEDYFLNVIQVGEANGAEPLDVSLIEINTHAGAVIADRVVLMGKAKNRVSSDVSFTVDRVGNYEFTISDLKSGTWNISCGNGETISVKVSEDGGVATFNGTEGRYTMTYAAGDSNKQFMSKKPNVPDYIGIRINGRFLYSDVKPFIENDRTLVPLRAIFEGVGAEVSYDVSTATATGVKNGITVSLTEGNTTAYVNGEPVELDVPAKTYYDRFMVPVRFIAESLGCNVLWKNEAQIVDISADVPTALKVRKKIYENELDIIGASSSGDDGTNIINYSYDGSLGTRWSAPGTETDNAWGIYDLGDVYALDKLYIAFHSGDKRKTTFAIDISIDAKTYTNILKTDSSGRTVSYEEYDFDGASARYIRFRGFGNSINEWNSITEIRVTEKK